MVKTRDQTPEPLNIAFLVEGNFFGCSVLKWLENTGYLFTSRS